MRSMVLILFLAQTWVKIANADRHMDPEDFAEIFEKKKDDEGLAHSLQRAAELIIEMGEGEDDEEIEDGLDMILTDEQREWLYGRHKNGTRVKRGGTTSKSKIWPNATVPYLIVESDFDGTERDQLREAMDVYESETCVQFIPRSDQVAYVQFQRGLRGCNSWLGMGGDSMQPINLGKGCRTIGTFLHEIGHALGLVHEHQLPQRDDYVHYNPTNVDPRYATQLEKYADAVTVLYGTEYDASSIMHYEPDSFSFDKRSHTLGVENPFLAVHIGRRHSNMLSFGDVRMVNTIYRCAKKCDAERVVECKEGFLNHRCECVTVDNYYARHCVNDPDEEENCYERLRNEQCHRAKYELHKKCAKACDFCPRLKPGDSAKEPLAPCSNVYPDRVMCDKWAAAGDCEHSYETIRVWMQRNCKRSCGVCELNVGNCPNVWPSYMCNGYPKRGVCQLESRGGEQARKNCPDSCQVCGRIEKGNCSNRLSDEICESRAKERHCLTQSTVMFQLCRKTCNRCDYNIGKCRNAHPKESECLWWAAINRCKAGEDMEFMRKNCSKVCNTCDYARKNGMEV